MLAYTNLSLTPNTKGILLPHTSVWFSRHFLELKISSSFHTLATRIFYVGLGLSFQLSFTVLYAIALKLIFSSSYTPSPSSPLPRLGEGGRRGPSGGIPPPPYTTPEGGWGKGGAIYIDIYVYTWL